MGLLELEEHVGAGAERAAGARAAGTSPLLTGTGPIANVAPSMRYYGPAHPIALARAPGRRNGMSEMLQQLESLTQRKSAVEWFRGLFSRVHVEVTDRDERFTLVHSGDRVVVEPGFHGQHPSFVIP